MIMLEKLKRPKRQKQTWGAGDYFMVPLNDGTFGLGQVVSLEPGALNSLVATFYDARFSSQDIDPSILHKESTLLAALFVTRDLLDSGRWKVFGNAAPPDVQKYLNIQALRKSGYIDARIIGSGIVQQFLNACHCLEPWNQFHKPDYLDHLLISPDRKPANLLMK
jgi:hypothetical protein